MQNFVKRVTIGKGYADFASRKLAGPLHVVLVTELHSMLTEAKKHASSHLFLDDVEQDFGAVEQTYVSWVLEIFRILAVCAKVLDPACADLV